MSLPRASSRTLFNVINALGRNLERSGIAPATFDVESVLAAARARTGLDDFGPPEPRQPLGLLLQDLEAHAHLTPLGRLSARRDMVTLLAHRLQLVADRARHPAIAEEVVARPLFILGLPRTGSTLIHHLLGEDPANRVGRAWEIMCPSPPPVRAGYETDPRITRAERELRWFDRLAPDFKTMHPLGARLGLECIAITAHALLSSRFHTMYRLPRYQAWLEAQDHRPAYEFHRRFLQHLQWRTPATRWVLKAPAHMPTLEALFAIYPDALVVQTHRDPVVVLASVVSLTATLRGAFSDAVDRTAIARVELRRWAEAVQHAIDVRTEGRVPDDQFVDVHYRDLVADPVGTVRGIYRGFGLPFSEDAERAMRRYLARHPTGENGAHHYSLAACGLDADEVSRTFKAYREHHGVAAEPIPG